MNQKKKKFITAFINFKKRANNNIGLKILCILIGIIFCIIGLVMLVTPGPGLLFLLLGLITLSIPFPTIATWLKKIKQKIKKKYRAYKTKK